MNIQYSIFNIELRMGCDIDAYSNWFDEIYEDDLYTSLIRQLVAAERSNKKLWKAMNFESSREVRACV